MKQKSLIFTEFFILTALISFILYLIYYFEKKTIEYSLLVILTYILIIYIHFFIFYPNKQNKSEINLNNITSINRLRRYKLITSSSKNKRTYTQPINIIIITNKPIQRIMDRNNWQECLTFSKNNIRIPTLLKCILTKCPPMTDAYFQSKPQNYAYQSNAKIQNRDHIRFWELGKINHKKIFISSISKDTNFSIKPHNGIYTPSHSINKNTDEIRNDFTEQLKSHFPNAKITQEPIGIKISKKRKKHYYTDGNINIINL